MLAKYWVFWTPKIEAQDAMALCTPHFERRLAVAHVFNVSFNIPRITECADCLTLGEVTPLMDAVTITFRYHPLRPLPPS
jgi:hypothetical protein